MGRRRRYRRYWSYGDYAVSKRSELSTTFGGIDRDVERLFLNLSSDDLRLLLADYEEDFGRSAAAYARDTYPKWKRGTVRMSGQVAERLLSLVPPLLSPEVRFELVKKLRAAHLHKLYRSVRSTPATWRTDLGPVVEEVVLHGRTSILTDDMKERVTWLADGDTASAERMLLAADEAEAATRVAYLKAEFMRLEQMVAQITQRTSISHSIDLPQGTIHVSIEVPKVSAWAKTMKWLGVT